MNPGAVSATPQDGFQQISAEGVDFFYNRSIDEVPAGDLKENFFWSSSLGTSFQGVAGDAYVFNGENGAIFADYRMSSSIGAVRCMRAP
jgi:hypothetical protein